MKIHRVTAMAFSCVSIALLAFVTAGCGSKKEEEPTATASPAATATPASGGQGAAGEAIKTQPAPVAPATE